MDSQKIKDDVKHVKENNGERKERGKNKYLAIIAVFLVVIIVLVIVLVIVLISVLRRIIRKRKKELFS